MLSPTLIISVIIILFHCIWCTYAEKVCDHEEDTKDRHDILDSKTDSDSVSEDSNTDNYYNIIESNTNNVDEPNPTEGWTGLKIFKSFVAPLEDNDCDEVIHTEYKRDVTDELTSLSEKILSKLTKENVCKCHGLNRSKSSFSEIKSSGDIHDVMTKIDMSQSSILINDNNQIQSATLSLANEINDNSMTHKTLTTSNDVELQSESLSNQDKQVFTTSNHPRAIMIPVFKTVVCETTVVVPCTVNNPVPVGIPVPVNIPVPSLVVTTTTINKTIAPLMTTDTTFVFITNTVYVSKRVVSNVCDCKTLKNSFEQSKIKKEANISVRKAQSDFSTALSLLRMPAPGCRGTVTSTASSIPSTSCISMISTTTSTSITTIIKSYSTTIRNNSTESINITKSTRTRSYLSTQNQTKKLFSVPSKIVMVHY